MKKERIIKTYICHKLLRQRFMIVILYRLHKLRLMKVNFLRLNKLKQMKMNLQKRHQFRLPIQPKKYRLKRRLRERSMRRRNNRKKTKMILMLSNTKQRRHRRLPNRLNNNIRLRKHCKLLEMHPRSKLKMRLSCKKRQKKAFCNRKKSKRLQQGRKLKPL